RRYTQFTSANGKNTKYTPLKAGVAYYMFVYGDRLNTVNAAGPNNTVISATGTLLTGDQLYTTSSANPLSGVTGRYTMLGNPFASPIDWTTIPRTNLANTFWGWDPNLSSTGGYVTVSSSATITLISPFTGSVGLNQYIQPGQGFFVRTTAASPTMTIREQDKVSNFNANAFRVQANSIPLIAVNLMYGSAGSRVMTDGALLAFDPSFRKGIGAEDASKLIGNGESVSLVTEAEVLSIDGRPLPAQDDTVQMHLGRLTRQQYTLQIFGSALDTAHVQPYLEDRYLKTIVPLVLNDTNWIDFEVIAGNAASSDSTRFRLLFKPTASNGVTVNLVATKQNATATLDWQISNESGVQKYKIERSANGTSFTSLTEVTATGATSYRYVDQNPLTGKNYYRVLPVYGNGSSFASGIVLLNMDVVSPVVTVFPNPVRSTNFTLRVTSLPAGRYRLGLFGGDGRAVYSETIEHTAGLFTRFVDLRAKLPAGMYYLRLESESGVYQEKILIQ
ncbi:MAG: type sorting protein, partial [Flaviaesturariibacter sp.]|nr:type sorting protein [Flaviaesturariibacter sp.]